MVGLAVDRDVEFGGGQMEFGGRSRSTGQEAFEGLQHQVPLLARLKEVSRDGGE